MTPDMMHLFWDFDGTLYDSYGQLSRAMLYALNDFGVFAPPTEVYALLKKSVYHACCVLAERFSFSVENLQAAFQKHHEAEEDFPPYEGVDACLHSLKRLGCKHYLYTHRDRKAIRQLEKDDLASFFTGFVTQEDGFPLKPAPNALKTMMRQYNVPREHAVMIGDRDLDIMAGHAAGTSCILFDPEDFYPNIETEYRVRSMREITLLAKGAKR